MAKYGVEFSAQAEEVKTKMRQTSLERYGVENPGGAAPTLEKIKKRFNEKYGDGISIVGDLLKLERFKAKIREVSLARYGVDHPSKSERAKAALR